MDSRQAKSSAVHVSLPGKKRVKKLDFRVGAVKHKGIKSKKYKKLVKLGKSLLCVHLFFCDTRKFRCTGIELFKLFALQPPAFYRAISWHPPTAINSFEVLKHDS